MRLQVPFALQDVWLLAPFVLAIISTWPAVQATSGGTPPADPQVRLKIITGGDPVSVADAHRAIANQREFAQRHGYSYEVHEGNYAYPWTAYWHKIHALLREMRAPPSPQGETDVVVWMDLDVVITNPKAQMLEQLLAAYPSSAILLTEDPMRGGGLPAVGRVKRIVNTGIVVARRGYRAERILDKLFEYGRQHRNAAFLPQDTDTLHEQDAFNWLLGGPLGRLLGRHLTVVPQRHRGMNLNTFPRNFYDAKYKDPEGPEWMVGDFAAHCSGLRDQLREWCVEDSCAAAEAALAGVDLVLDTDTGITDDASLAAILPGGTTAHPKTTPIVVEPVWNNSTGCHNTSNSTAHVVRRLSPRSQGERAGEGVSVYV